MARPCMELPSRSSLVPAAMRLAAACGLDVEALAWRFGLPAEVARQEDATAPFDVAGELLQTVARSTSDDVALRLAPELSSRRETLAGLVVRASCDVREALRWLARWVPLVHEGLEAILDEEGARWVLRAPRRPLGAGRFVHELVLARVVHQVRVAAGALTPSRLWFAHARPPELAPLVAWFGTNDLAFGCRDSGFAVPLSELDRPTLHPDRRTVEALAPLVDADLGTQKTGATLAGRVAMHVAASLPQGTDVTEVAAALRMSPRTLQRRLEQEQTRFTAVVDRARLEAAQRLLADPALTLAEIAFRVGFADLATFSRAFKRWTGKPPGQWRRS